MKPSNSLENNTFYDTYWRVQSICKKVPAHSSLEPPLEYNQNWMPLEEFGGGRCLLVRIFPGEGGREWANFWLVEGLPPSPSVGKTLGGGSGGLFNGQSLLNLTKVLCWWSLNSRGWMGGFHLINWISSKVLKQCKKYRWDWQWK